MILFLLSIIPLQLRHATTPDQIAWGLMNCTHLEQNEGMTFTLPEPTVPSFWMFNCKIDLSVAFLDENKIIREIHEMKAYPHLMDLKRPIHSLRDLSLYPSDDPIRHFFATHSTNGHHLTSFALEMNKGFFKENEIKPFDLLVFDQKSSQGYISKSLDIEPYLESSITPFSENAIHALYSSLPGTYTIIFYDSSQNFISTHPINQDQVCISPSPCSYFSVK